MCGDWDDRLAIYYDGKCPVCRRAMRRVERHLPVDAFCAVNIADAGFEARAHGLDLVEVRRTLHVRLPDGRVVRGIDAVVALWERMPRRRWLAALCRLPGVHAVAGWAYRFVASHRHLLPG